jgi:hypothetical protein
MPPLTGWQFQETIGPSVDISEICVKQWKALTTYNMAINLLIS